MSEVSPPATPPEQAPLEPPPEPTPEPVLPPACHYCKQPLGDPYFRIAQRSACTSCRDAVVRDLALNRSSTNLFRAFRYGALWAVAGSIAWAVITKLTGYEIGVVAIAIGYLVGKAVRKGSGGLGGRRYQYLAMFLTYSAIALAALPVILETLRSTHPADSSAAPSVGLGGVLVAWLLLVAIAYAWPFLAGVQNLMGWIIIAIGLYEAWKLTRAVPIEVVGPLSAEPAAPVGAPADASTGAI